jgi:hypothetical protein
MASIQKRKAEIEDLQLQLRNQEEEASNVANLDGLPGREEALMQIDSSKFSISYSEQYIRERNAELKVLEEKIHRVKQRDGKLSRKIEVAEVSSMRTHAIYQKVCNYGGKVKSKLELVNSRTKSLLGDCIVLAASICFLGHYSAHERIELRAAIVKHITENEEMTCSKDWLIDGKANPNPKV